jgi:hypothetical protein
MQMHQVTMQMHQVTMQMHHFLNQMFRRRNQGPPASSSPNRIRLTGGRHGSFLTRHAITALVAARKNENENHFI